MPTLLGRDGWHWLVEPQASRVEADRVSWTCPGNSDLWRVTEGVESKHDAAAYVAPVSGDFRLEAAFDASLTDLYDQVGVLAQASQLRWLKVGVELDGGLWLSAVHTRDESDWSREPFGGLPLELAVERRSGTVSCSLREDEAWRIFRVLYLPGPIEIGPYSCAPKGAGFEAVMRSPVLTEG